MLNTTGCSADPTATLPCQHLLELAAPLQDVRLHTDVVENLAYIPDVTISGAYFGRIPTRGILMTTRGKVRVSVSEGRVCRCFTF